MDLAAVLDEATQPGLLEAKLLLDHPKRMLNLGADVSFGSLYQILQLPIWSGLPQSCDFTLQG
jgi:hypothetical protein